MYIVYRKEKFISLILQFKTWMNSTTLECWTFWYNLLAKREVSSLFFPVFRQLSFRLAPTGDWRRCSLYELAFQPTDPLM